ncbi:MAG TPA: hypothetical protein VF399_00320 [bacterium]
MSKYTTVPAITPNQLIKLLCLGEWVEHRRSKDGVCIKRKIGKHWQVAFIPIHDAVLDSGTLHAILGTKQTGIGRKGLLDLLNKYGLP